MKMLLNDTSMIIIKIQLDCRRKFVNQVIKTIYEDNGV